MSYYLLIKKLKVTQANALSSAYAVTSAPIMAANLFAHAIGIATDTPHTGVAMIHHDARYRADKDLKAGFGIVQFQQKRAASFINKDDYATGTTSLALQPAANIDLLTSLVIEFDSPPDTEAVQAFIRNGRFAGGQIEKVGEIVVFHEYDEEGFSSIPGSGYWLLDRRDCLEGENPAEEMIKHLGTKPSAEAGNAWLTPVVAGYALISAPQDNVQGVRSLSDDSYPQHAFAEPMLGLAQYVSVRSCESMEIPFWRPEWIGNDIFLLTQKPQ